MAGNKQSSARLTYFVVQCYKAAPRGGVSMDPPIQARDLDHAKRLVERYKGIRAGVVAFSRTGDPATGEWDEAVILARHGRVDAEFDAMDVYAGDDEPEADQAVA